MSKKLRRWAASEEEFAVPSLLEALDASDRPAELAERVRSLLPLLAEHFHAEEEPGGFFQELVTLAPERSRQVEELTAEHQELLASLRAFTALIDTGNASPDELMRRREELVTRLRAHQQAERLLLMDSYLWDTGGGS